MISKITSFCGAKDWQPYKIKLHNCKNDLFFPVSCRVQRQYVNAPSHLSLKGQRKEILSFSMIVTNLKSQSIFLVMVKTKSLVFNLQDQNYSLWELSMSLCPSVNLYLKNLHSLNIKCYRWCKKEALQNLWHQNDNIIVYIRNSLPKANMWIVLRNLSFSIIFWPD